MSGTFSQRNATPECIRSTQPSASSSTSSFRPWGLDSSSHDTATTNERRVNAAQRHQPTPYGLPAPARGVAQNPLGLLPTIAFPRVTTTRAARSARNPRSQIGAQALSSQSRTPKSIDYKFACVILPTSVSPNLLHKKTCNLIGIAGEWFYIENWHRYPIWKFSRPHRRQITPIFYQGRTPPTLFRISSASSPRRSYCQRPKWMSEKTYGPSRTQSCLGKPTESSL